MTVSLREQVEFQFRNYILQRPLTGFQPGANWTLFSAERGAQMLEELQRDGITAVPGFMSPEMVADLRAAAQRTIDGRHTWQGYAFSEKNQIHNIMQPLMTVAAARAALSPDIRRLCELYFRRPVRMTEADYRKAPPMDDRQLRELSPKYVQGYSTMSWHYDPRGKMLKIQVYLTDTMEDGQNFSYIKGSQSGFRLLSSDESRFADGEIDRRFDQARITECYGRAGDAYLFDPNGIHRLRRKDTIGRETITFYYTPGAMLRQKPMYVPREVFDALDDTERHYLSIVGVATPAADGAV